MKKNFFLFISVFILSALLPYAASATDWYTPQPGITWQWQLSGKINPSYDVSLYDIDLFDAPQNVIDDLHKRNIKVICYFSAGSWEKFRDDAKNIPKSAIGRTVDGWPDEKWLDISRYQDFASVMEKRLDLAVQKKCDGVEPDNVDGYENKTGFKLAYDNQLAYNKWLTIEAHKRNLSIALKNDVNQIKDLISYFDFAINEECFRYKECHLYAPFIAENKAVLHVEYGMQKNKFCEKAIALQFSSLKMTRKLNGKRDSCSK
jgi:hypothetical protein